MEYKRKYRELDDDVKKRISQSCKNKKKSFSHREHLSQALKNYWSGVKSKHQDLNMQEYLQGGNNSSEKPSNQNAE